MELGDPDSIRVRERKSVSKHRTHKGGEMFWDIGGSRPALRPDATGELFEQQNRKRRGDADNREANAEIPVDPAAGEQRDRSDHQPDFKKSFGQVEAIGAGFSLFHLFLHGLGVVLFLLQVLDWK